MKIKKIINNNVLCVVDQRGCELIVTGRGIGFGRHRGETIDEGLIERRYRMEDKDRQRSLRELVEKIPVEHLDLTESLIAHIKTQIPRSSTNPSSSLWRTTSASPSSASMQAWSSATP